MNQKLYLNLNIIQKGTYKQTHQLIKVSDIKEFHPLLYGEQTVDFFKSQNIKNMLRGEVNKTQPLRIRVIAGIFDLLISKVNQKIGSIYKMNTNILNIVQGQNFNPCIIIEREMTTEKVEAILVEPVNKS